MNLTEAKNASKKGMIFTAVESSELFRSQAKSDYEKKKEEEKRNIHSQIKRVSESTIIV